MRRRHLPSTIPGRAERGFSVIELLVALFIAVEILIAMAVAFDVHNKVSRVQLQVTDMQQALRIAQWDITRMTRMAGRGGLKADLEPAAVFDPDDTPPQIQGRAIEVRNNVTGDARYIARDGDPDGPRAFEGSDILTVRGCFSTPVYQLNPGFDADLDDNDVADDAITLTITRDTASLIAQPLRALKEEIEAYAGTPKGYLLIASWVSTADWGIAAITSASVSPPGSDDPDSIALVLDLNIDSPLNPLVSGTRTFPVTMAASSACFLEEYRYYVRDVQEGGDPITPLRPRLTRARFEPGTELPYMGAAFPENLTLDLADQVFDLQIALGLDTDFLLGGGTGPGSFEADIDNIGDDDAIYEGTLDTADTASDDWLFNDPDDNPADARYVTHAYSTLVGDPVDVYFVRVTTAARTARPDNTYQAPDLDTRGTGDWLEDHDFDDPAEPAAVFNDATNRKHRRRTLTTIVEMRNI